MTVTDRSPDAAAERRAEFQRLIDTGTSRTEAAAAVGVQVSTTYTWRRAGLPRTPRRTSRATGPQRALPPVPDWHQHGACGGYWDGHQAMDGAGVVRRSLPVQRDVFFGTTDDREPRHVRDAREELAKAICRDCPVQGSCLQEALTHRLPGVWGGTTDAERRELKTTQAGAA